MDRDLVTPIPLLLSNVRLAKEEGYQSRVERHVGASEMSAQYNVRDIIGGRYEVSRIYHGNRGVVYGAYDLEQKMPVALKTLYDKFLENRTIRDQFLKDAHLWVGLDKHPFFVSALSVEMFDRRPILILEHVAHIKEFGGRLVSWLGKTQLKIEVAVELAMQIAQAMQHLDNNVPGLAHRNLTPMNVFVNHARKAKVTSFGLPLTTDSDAGIPAYLAPEIWNNEVADQGADLYAFGCILYEMFTGRSTYRARTILEWKDAHLNYTPLPPSKFAPDIPEAFESLILACLAKKKERRPDSWDDVVDICAQEFRQLSDEPIETEFRDYKIAPDDLAGICASLVELERPNEALVLCEKAVEINPVDSVAWNKMGIALELTNRPGDAIAAFESALFSDPQDEEAWIGKGNALVKMKRYADAIEAFNAALAINPLNSGTWVRKGMVFDSIVLNSDALACYEAALELSPESAPIWTLKGHIYFDMNLQAFEGSEFDEVGMAAFEKALELDPDYAPAWNGKGCALKQMQLIKQALSAFEKAIETNPGYEQAIKNRDEVLATLKRQEEIKATYHRGEGYKGTDN